MGYNRGKGGIVITVFIDADGCPVVDAAVRLAKRAGVECVIICDASHIFNKDGAKTITVEKGSDSVDFVLVNLVKKGDVVVTQDYGLAAMCLARGAKPISQDGMTYDDFNIESLLMQRHMAKKVRSAGGRLKGPAKRDEKQNKAFEQNFWILLEAWRT